MSFSVSKSHVALCNNERAITYDVDSDAETVVVLPDLESSKRTDTHNNTETHHMITSVTFSEDGKYFAVCTNRKLLCLYETRDSKLLSSRTLARSASRVRFSPNNDIVVADKAGDVYLFPTGSPTESGTWILGHLSMLLDVLVTQDTRHILTTDRDEKIRVSMFPNCYNIVSYCLGHTKFVTNITELPHDRSILVSCGGDGVLKLWDYKHGTELTSVNFYDKVSKRDVERFNQNLRSNHYDESVDIIPVKHLRASHLGEEESLVVLSFYSSNVLLIFIVNSNETQLTANYSESVTAEAEPVECLLLEHDLWVLTDTGLQVYKFQDNKFVARNDLSCLDRLNKLWEMLKNTVVNQNVFPVLYKRTHDNVQEYLERKKLRLASSTE